MRDQGFLAVILFVFVFIVIGFLGYVILGAV